MRIQTMPGSTRPCGYQQIASSAALQELTVPAGGRWCMIVFTAAVRIRDDGVDPTAAIGFPIVANTPFVYTGNLSRLKYIAQSGAAVADILYYS